MRARDPWTETGVQEGEETVEINRVSVSGAPMSGRLSRTEP